MKIKPQINKFTDALERRAPLAALPFDTRAELTLPETPALLASQVAKEAIEAVNAMNLGATSREIITEIDEAVTALLNLKNRCKTA